MDVIIIINNELFNDELHSKPTIQQSDFVVIPLNFSYYLFNFSNL